MWESTLMIPAMLLLGILALFSNDVRVSCLKTDTQARRFFTTVTAFAVAAMAGLAFVAYRINQVAFTGGIK
jgi:hypothetical protein